MFRISDPHPTHANLADSLVKSQTKKIEHLSNVLYFKVNIFNTYCNRNDNQKKEL